MSEPTKLCKWCDTEKPHSDFYFQRGRPSHPCKECKCAAQRKRNDPEKTRRWDLKKKYGITPEDYNVMFSEQDGGCAICGRTDMSNGKTYLAVDHCHETGAVRGLLCNNCNLMLGHSQDDSSILRKAADYKDAHDRQRHTL